jgi:uncharacterized protein (DUF2126 family)
LQTDQALFSQEIVALDSAIAQHLPDIWVGAEPTFTLRGSESPEWLSEPLGGRKELLAWQLVNELRQRHPGSLVLRTLGRQYPGEQQPRWSIGMYESRNGQAIWPGPSDPLNGPVKSCGIQRFEAFLLDLLAQLSALGWQARGFKAAMELPHRLVFRMDDEAIQNLDLTDERWFRPSLHREAIPLSGLTDELATEGLYLLSIGWVSSSQGNSCLVMELPAFPNVAGFRVFLGALAKAAADLPGLILQGFPPPVDASVAWTTVTPDPAVLEINQAPYPKSAMFLQASRELHEISTAIGLSPYRLQYNGTQTDSGGGGQITLGGPSPEQSPFLLKPSLLPRLLRYVIRHPALSYWFGTDYLGGTSQSPRPDEGMRELFHELRLALFQLERTAKPEPEVIWRSLAPFLSDSSGNSHRSDINIEKLWNPYLGRRGLQGLVEFRAFRMATTPERATAISALLRAIVAMLALRDVVPELTDWGDELHDRFALPFYLRRDLLSVFADLRGAGLGLGAETRRVLQDDPSRDRWQMAFNGCRLSLERALEFWPLVGDAADQEGEGSRLVDASTVRWQLILRPTEGGDADDFRRWRLATDGLQVPLRYETDEAGELGLFGLRLREFEPWIGLHPAIKPRMPLQLVLSHPGLDQALSLQLHGWQPEGLPYQGLPADQEAARARREERLIATQLPADSLTEAVEPPGECLSSYAMDLRWCDVNAPDY